MFVFRLLAWFFVAAAIALLGADAVSSLENDGLTLRTTADLLMLFSIDGEALAASAPAGLSQVLRAAVGFYPWAILGVIGILLTVLFRPID